MAAIKADGPKLFFFFKFTLFSWLRLHLDYKSLLSFLV